jgi:hypothetical protein
MQMTHSLISPRLTNLIPNYRTPEQLDREALRMSIRDFDHTGGWRFAAIKSNRRYLQAENDLVLLKETLKQQAAALEAKDDLIKHLGDTHRLGPVQAAPFRFTYDSTYRPGDPRRDLTSSSVPRTATGYSPAARPREECPLDFLLSDLAALDRLIGQLHPQDSLGGLSLRSRRAEIADKIRQRGIAVEPLAEPPYTPEEKAFAATCVLPPLGLKLPVEKPLAVLTGKSGMWTQTPEARAASDQALRRIAAEPAPGRIAD